MTDKRARRAVSRDRAAPAQPRHLRRAVLRPRLRLRRHADLAHAARRTSRRSGVLAGHAAVPRGVVGVGLHLLDHQLARSRKDSGPAAAVRDDARRAGAVDLDPDGIRRPRPVVCHRLCGDAGRQDGLPVAVDAAVAPAARATNAIRITAWLATSAVFWIAGGLAEGAVAAGAVGHRARHRICLAGGAVLDPALRRVRR